MSSAKQQKILLRFCDDKLLYFRPMQKFSIHCLPVNSPAICFWGARAGRSDFAGGRVLIKRGTPRQFVSGQQVMFGLPRGCYLLRRWRFCRGIMPILAALPPEGRFYFAGYFLVLLQAEVMACGFCVIII